MLLFISSVLALLSVVGAFHLHQSTVRKMSSDLKMGVCLYGSQGSRSPLVNWFLIDNKIPFTMKAWPSTAFFTHKSNILRLLSRQIIRSARFHFSRTTTGWKYLSQEPFCCTWPMHMEASNQGPLLLAQNTVSGEFVHHTTPHHTTPIYTATTPHQTTPHHTNSHQFTPIHTNSHCDHSALHHTATTPHHSQMGCMGQLGPWCSLFRQRTVRLQDPAW